MTPNKEDYLKCLQELGEKHSKITNKQIAEHMQVSAPATSEMIKKLIAEEWIVKDKELGYCLSATGKERVSALYRKHRLIEVFLMHQLRYTVDEIHQEAEVLEHTVSDTFIDRLDENLGFPPFCPHGGTIPKKGQMLVEVHNQTLAQIETCGAYRICRVYDHIQLLKYMEEQGLAIGERVQVEKIDSFAKTYTISCKDKQIVIPEAVAQQIYVEQEGN